MAAAVQPGYGWTDSIAEGLEGFEREIDAFPESPNGKKFKSLGLEIVYSAKAVNSDGAWGSRDMWEEMQAGLAEVRRSTVLRAVEAVPTSGFGLGLDRESEIESTAAKANATFADDITRAVIAKTAKKAAKLAQRFADAGTALEEAVAEARLESDSPKEMTMANLAMRADWETRARAQKAPSLWLATKIRGYLEHRKLDRLPDLMAAADAICLEQMTPSKGRVQQQATHYGRYSAVVDGNGPVVEALRLQQLLKETRLQLEDPAIAFYDSLLDRMRAVFRTLVGASARFMSASQRQKLYYDVDGSATQGTADLWSPLPPAAWLPRFLPSSGALDTAPSGWSPIVAQGHGSTPIRAPAPGSRR